MTYTLLGWSLDILPFLSLLVSKLVSISSKAANVSWDLAWHCSLTSTSLSFLRLSLPMTVFLLVTCLLTTIFFHNFCNHQIVVTVTGSSSKRSVVVFCLSSNEQSDCVISHQKNLCVFMSFVSWEYYARDI